MAGEGNGTVRRSLSIDTTSIDGSYSTLDLEFYDGEWHSFHGFCNLVDGKLLSLKNIAMNTESALNFLKSYR